MEAINWGNLLIALIGALVGGGLTGFFAFKATQKAHQNALELAERNEKKLIKSLLQAINDEIETLWNRYMSTMGVQVEALAENGALLFTYPVVHDYFTIYNGNAFLIGRIENHDLRKSIVASYTKARGLIDAFRMNNDIIQKFEHFSFLYMQTNDEAYKTTRDSYYAALVNYSKKIKQSHFDQKEEVENLLLMMKRLGILSDPEN